MTDVFRPLRITGKYPICAIPIIFDTYQSCDYNCKYCYNHNRMILAKEGFNKQIDIDWLKKTFHRIFDEGKIYETNLLEVLLQQDITIHGGVQSDCFQPREQKQGKTKQAIKIMNEYDRHILFTTKTDRLYDVPVNPNLHSFSLSISNLHNNKIEPNVPQIENRIQFYHELKDEGYRVSIRIEPFLPNITEWKEIIDTFIDADHFHTRVIRLNPQSKEQNKKLLEELGMRKTEFKNYGTLQIEKSRKYYLYQEMIDYFNERGLSYSFSDSDMHYLNNNTCCCGDKMIKKGTNFHNTYLIKKYGLEYNIEDVMNEIDEVKDCSAYPYFASNRANGCRTVEDFWKDRFNSKASPFCPKWQYEPLEVKDKAQTTLGGF